MLINDKKNLKTKLAVEYIFKNKIVLLPRITSKYF